MPVRKYPKVGDKIVITKEVFDDNYDEYKIGDVCEVLETYKEDGELLVRVRSLNHADGWWIRPESYKLYVEEKEVVKKAKKAAKVDELPTTKIEKHQIVGQDTNKAILNVGIDKDLPVLLIGETGTGKTSLIREAAIDRKQPWIRFNLTGETTVDEFVGKYELEKGATVWRDGVLLDAMKNGKWLIVDEINVALPEILFVLHSLLDDDKMVTVASHSGEVVTPHKDFRFFATMNPTDEYAGTKELNKAFQSRFSIILKVDYPNPTIEARIVSDKTGVDLADATKMADVAVALRKAKADEKIFYTCSTRDLLQWGMLASHLDPAEAFRVSVLNKSNGDADAIMEIYKHVIGRYLKVEDSAKDVQLTIDWFEGKLKELAAEKTKFEEHKEKIRKEITEDIIKQLTKEEALQSKSPVEGVFAGDVV